MRAPFAFLWRSLSSLFVSGPARSRRAPSLEDLEGRTLPAVGVTACLLANGTLSIRGTPGNDTIVVRDTNGRLSIDGLKFSVSAARVGRLWIDAGAGNDLVDLRPTEGQGFTAPATILGGAGNDTLYGGVGDDVLYGGPGSDTLDGGPGNNWLDAGGPGEHVVNGWNAYGWAANGTSYRDVVQGDTGTCSFCAALATAARRGVDLADRIHYLGHFTYRVRLFDPAADVWTTRDVHFNGRMVQTSGPGWVTDPGTTPEGKFWTVLYQRAYLELMGFNPMNGDQVASFPGDSLNHALAVVTGTPVTCAGSTMLTPVALRQDLLQGDGLSACTGTVSSPYLIGDHTYMVDNVFVQGTSWYVRLYNPWGMDGGVTQGRNDGLVTLDWATFVANCNYCAWAGRSF
jgi:hypothetical protein